MLLYTRQPAYLQTELQSWFPPSATASIVTIYEQSNFASQVLSSPLFVNFKVALMIQCFSKDYVCVFEFLLMLGLGILCSFVMEDPIKSSEAFSLLFRKV